MGRIHFFRSDVSNPPTQRKTKYKSKNDFFNNLYNRGRKDLVGKRKFVDMSHVTDRDIERMLQDGDVEGLEYVVSVSLLIQFEYSYISHIP